MAKSNGKKPITLNASYTFDDETENFHRFALDKESKEVVVGNLYVKKTAVPKGRSFKEAEITITLR